jgi:hypothetical protein
VEPVVGASTTGRRTVVWAAVADWHWRSKLADRVRQLVAVVGPGEMVVRVPLSTVVWSVRPSIVAFGCDWRSAVVAVARFD